jgi:hypothetical protein
MVAFRPWALLKQIELYQLSIEKRREEIMANTAATKKRTDEELFEGFTDSEKKFLYDLAGFLEHYENFAGNTPFDRALAATFQMKIGILREGKLPPPPALMQTEGMCLCYDPVRKKIVLCSCK